MKTCFVDYRLSKDEEEKLIEFGVNIVKVPKANVYSAIDGHPDIQLHIVSKPNQTLVVHKNICNDFLKSLNSLNIPYELSDSDLGYKYPEDIILNCVSSENYLIHNLKYTDNKILSINKGKKLINISQGYTKCSTAIISEDAYITSDLPLSIALRNEGLDVLLIPPGDIILPGLDYGFIGGTCGLLDSNTLAFFGSLENYKYGADVKKFLKKHNVKPFYLSNGKLIDRGSILIWNS